MGFRQVLVVGAFALHQIRHRVQPQAVDAQFRPVAQHRQHLPHHPRIVEIQVRLMVVKPVPVIGLGGVVPGPVGPFGIHEDDARAGVFAIVVRPYIEVPVHRAWLRHPGALEPGMLIGGVVDHQFRDHPNTPVMRRGDEALYIRQASRNPDEPHDNRRCHIHHPAAAKDRTATARSC